MQSEYANCRQHTHPQTKATAILILLVVGIYEVWKWSTLKSVTDHAMFRKNTSIRSEIGFIKTFMTWYYELSRIRKESWPKARCAALRTYWICQLHSLVRQQLLQRRIAWSLCTVMQALLRKFYFLQVNFFPPLFDNNAVEEFFTEFSDRRTESHSVILIDFIHAVQRTHKKVQTKIQRILIRRDLCSASSHTA
jgi:hypothetical protein